MYVCPISRLQQNCDWLLCVYPIRWGVLKERSPLAFETSIQSGFSPLCSTEWEAADGQTGRQTAKGRWSPDEALWRVSCWPLSDTQAEESNQHSNQFLLFLLHQHFITVNFISNWYRDIRGAEGMERFPQIYSQDQIRFYLHIMHWMNNNCKLHTVGCLFLRVQFQLCSSFKVKLKLVLFTFISAALHYCSPAALLSGPLLTVAWVFIPMLSKFKTNFLENVQRYGWARLTILSSGQAKNYSGINPFLSSKRLRGDR